MLVKIFSKENGFIGLNCYILNPLIKFSYYQTSLLERKFFNKNTIGIFVKKFDSDYDVVYINNNLFICRTEYIAKL